jgi:hypothetical protein
MGSGGYRCPSFPHSLMAKPAIVNRMILVRFQVRERQVSIPKGREPVLKLKRLLATLATVLLVTAGVSVVTATPAAAGTSGADCYSGYLCIYEHTGYSGSEYDIWAGGYRHTCVTFGWGFWWDRASSIKNQTGTDVTFYNNAYCGGGSLWMYSGMNISNLSLFGANDSLDSVYIN